MLASESPQDLFGRVKILGHRILVQFDPPPKLDVELPEELIPPNGDGTVMLVGSKVKGNALLPGTRVRCNRKFNSVPVDFEGRPCRIVSTLDVQVIFDVQDAA